ncbi:PaaI family thioesterase [Sporomusa termitida]|uniref:Acyl-coenzyme A thioeSPTERase PaaI n=1 Tax=Sporomusa termitida TaxID=2377 RepID=A0A517DW80_9FIRM|nr:PaaI family thioesterase [Sporomusa termitida]QDR81615.1 Acyl-coenzyme A thioeSPTERase PaaI [Sporomusa termitida]
MTEQRLLLKNHLNTRYAQNSFVNLLQIEIVEIDAGMAKLSMPILHDKHTNLYNIAHGGALASLADTGMGMACASLGQKVVTLEMNLNFIRKAECQEAILAVCTVIHHGSQTMIAGADIFDDTQKLLVKARGTFFITGSFLAEVK